MLVIGLTGRSCAGKNCFADEFSSLGIPVVDVDRLGHAALVARSRLVAEVFGPEVVASDGSIDRKALGRIVFADPVQLRKLESISHPWMVEECCRLITEATASGAPAIVLNAALLHRMRLESLCDVVMFVKVPFYTRYRRAKERDNVSWEGFRAREKSQFDIDPKVFKGSVPVIIVDNDGDPALIHRQVMEFCDTIGERMSLSHE